MPEIRPVGLAEVELGVRALPEQETRETLLTRGANHEIGVRLAARVQVLGNVIDVDQDSSAIAAAAALSGRIGRPAVGGE